MVVTLIQMSFFNPIEVELLDSGNVNFFREILAYSRNFSEYCIADRHSDDPVFPLVVKGQEEGKGDKSQFLPSWFCAGHPPLINDDIKMNKTIVGIGEALWDVFPGGKKLGGAPANFAFHTSQFGLDALAVSAVGKDSLGDETLAEFDKKGLHYVMPRVDFPTGTVQVTLDEQGVPSYDIKTNVAWDNIPFTEKIKEIARKCCAVCFGSLAQRNDVSRRTIRNFLDIMPKDSLKIFDINLRQNFYSKDIIKDSLKACNVLKINDEELITLGRIFGYSGLDIENKCWLILGKYDLDMLILTCGVNGSYVFSRRTMSFRETPRVKVADTVGAGDSFTGSFAAAILHGMPVGEAHKLAVDVSAYVCTQDGAMPSLPKKLTERVGV